jgi:hypothetical protein
MRLDRPDVLRDVRRDVQIATALDEGLGVVGFVRAERLARFSWQFGEHLDRRLALGDAVGFAQTRIDHQAVAVLGEHVPHVRGYRSGVGGRGRELGVGVGFALVRLVGALVTLEVHFRVAAATRDRRRCAILGQEALVRGPGANEGPIHRVVLATEQPLRLGLVHEIATNFNKLLAEGQVHVVGCAIVDEGDSGGAVRK